MTVLYSKNYIERDMFVIERDNKIIPVYRSSGLSGTGHDGQILPFGGLLEKPKGLEALRYIPGYIYKRLYYNGRWFDHHKNISDFKGVPELMEEIREFLVDESPEYISYPQEDDQFIEFVVKEAKEINEAIRSLNKEYEFFDMARLAV